MFRLTALLLVVFTACCHAAPDAPRIVPQRAPGEEPAASAPEGKTEHAAPDVSRVVPQQAPGEEPAASAPEGKVEQVSEESKLFESAVKKMEELAGYHLVTRIDVNPGEEPVNIKMSGLYRRPDFMYMKIEGLGGKAPTEAFFKGDKSAVRVAFRKVWSTAEQAGLQLTTRRMWKPDEILERARKYAKGARAAEPETIRDVPCAVLEIAIAVEAVPELMEKFDVSEDVGLDMETVKMSTRTWIGKEDGLIHRFEFRLDGMASGFPEEEGAEEESEEDEEDTEEVPVSVHFVSDFSKFGKELDVAVPEEAKSLLGVE